MARAVVRTNTQTMSAIYKIGIAMGFTIVIVDLQVAFTTTTHVGRNTNSIGARLIATRFTIRRVDLVESEQTFALICINAMPIDAGGIAYWSAPQNSVCTFR